MSYPGELVSVVFVVAQAAKLWQTIPGPVVMVFLGQPQARVNVTHTSMSLLHDQEMKPKAKDCG
ncbi:hypothetical protein E4U54_000942, partial [Claviceps lovelessii]